MNKRVSKKIFKVFCEGTTEYNYFEVLRKSKNLNLALRPIDMKGGGYSSFLNEVRKDANSNCIAKFIVIDGDRANNVIEEQHNLKKLIDYCANMNNKGSIPHILIVNCPDFEYVACLHSPEYNGQEAKNFIINRYQYKDIGKFKADKEIFAFLNSKEKSYNVMLSKLQKSDLIIENCIKITKKQFLIRVKTKSCLDNLGRKSSNIFDFFEVIREFEDSI